MDVLVLPDGTIKAIYAEDIDFRELGEPLITRASHVEADCQNRWIADLTPVAGPVLGPFALRSEALEAEQAWLAKNWLVTSS
jgi:hypothetical protein